MKKKKQLPQSPTQKRDLNKKVETKKEGLPAVAAKSIHPYVMLESFGAEVKTAESAREALAVLEKFKSPLAKTPALALTAYASREDIQPAILAGFQVHVAKPVKRK